MQSSAVAAAAAAGMTPRLVHSLSRLLRVVYILVQLVALDKLEDNRLATAAECISCVCVCTHAIYHGL